MDHASDPDYVLGESIFAKLVRGDGLLGLIADVPAAMQEMLDALWRAALRGSSLAYLVLGDCHAAALRPQGAFEGVEPTDARHRPWSGEASLVRDEDDLALQFALRAYCEAALLGERQAIRRYAQLSRGSTRANQQRGAALLARIELPTPEELYQLGLVQHWLGELEASAMSHRHAAELGSADAQFELYVYCARGLGMPIDFVQSQAWLQRAAAQNHPRALYNLGASYAAGDRGDVDLERAAEYYRRAAEHGNGRAAGMLGVMILQDEIAGTTRQAGAWFDRADELGFPSWELLESVGLEDPRGLA